MNKIYLVTKKVHNEMLTLDAGDFAWDADSIMMCILISCKRVRMSLSCHIN